MTTLHKFRRISTIYLSLTLFSLFTILTYDYPCITALDYITPVADAGPLDPEGDGVKEPVLSKLMEREITIPHTKQIVDREMANQIELTVEDALGAANMLGNSITVVTDPHADLLNALNNLSDSAANGVIDTNEADEIMDILLGKTSGRIYDGFALLNFNRWNDDRIPATAFPADAVAGEYKTKRIRHSGKSERNFKKPSEGVNPAVLEGEDEVTIWEVDVNMLWYGQQFDADTFFVHIPIINSADNVPSPDDTIRINYHIYSLVEEDFAPIQLLNDADPKVEFPGESSVALPHKAEDTVWVQIDKNTVAHITVQYTALRFIRGIYTWGWRVHPPRIHFMDFLRELNNAHTKKIELNPRGRSMSERNRGLSIDDIGDAAPEKKVYEVVRAVVDGEVDNASDLFAMLNNADTEPAGTYKDWIDLMTNQIQLPPEVSEVLASEGMGVDDYDYVSVFMNNEMYGIGSFHTAMQDWKQGDVIHSRIFNLDNHTHYYRSVDFGEALNDDMTANASNGVFSFEIFDFKPTYGAPKAAEMQWRAGWGFRPHFSIIQQEWVFPNEADHKGLKPFVAPEFSVNRMAKYYGYQFSADNRRGDFVFDPPPYIIQSWNDMPFDRLYECSATNVLDLIVKRWRLMKNIMPNMISQGLVIGQETEGFGTARMCGHAEHTDMFCVNDLSQYHPLSVRNVDTNLDGINDKLYFPTFLINPNTNGGDIIPPTMAWAPFLYLSPENGTIFIDPNKPEKGYWTDLTFAHGRPIQPMSDIEVNIEMPRSSGQLLYQFDDLFHDNAIFSPHPFSSQR